MIAITSKERANFAVLIGGSLPAHDRVFDLAENVGTALDDLRAYVTKVRDAEQAASAVTELLAHLIVEGTSASQVVGLVDDLRAHLTGLVSR